MDTTRACERIRLCPGETNAPSTAQCTGMVVCLEHAVRGSFAADAHADALVLLYIYTSNIQVQYTSNIQILHCVYKMYCTINTVQYCKTEGRTHPIANPRRAWRRRSSSSTAATTAPRSRCGQTLVKLVERWSNSKFEVVKNRSKPGQDSMPFQGAPCIGCDSDPVALLDSD